MRESRGDLDLTDGFDLIDPGPYGRGGHPRAAFATLRARAPIHRCHPTGYAMCSARAAHIPVERRLNG